MSEIWKTYKNGYYEISNLGKVRNTETGKLLSGSIQNIGVSEGTISTCANSKRQHSKYEFIKMKI